MCGTWQPTESLLHSLSAMWQRGDRSGDVLKQRPFNFLSGKTQRGNPSPGESDSSSISGGQGRGHRGNCFEHWSSRSGTQHQVTAGLGMHRGMNISCSSSLPQWEALSLLPFSPRHKFLRFSAKVWVALLPGSSHWGANTCSAAHQHCGGRA